MNYDGDLLALDFCIPIKLAGNMSLNFRKSFISTGYQALCLGLPGDKSQKKDISTVLLQYNKGIYNNTIPLARSFSF